MDGEDGMPNDWYRIRTIQFFGSHRQILLQSKNGPCPLLGLANVLLLRNQLTLPVDASYVSLDDLVQLLTDLLLDLDRNRSAEKDGDDAAWRGNFDGCLRILRTLHVGMDVNVKFKNTEAFEFTQNLGIFDLFGIRLLHGWVVSEQDVVMHALLGNESYNTAVDRIFELQDNSSPNDRQEASLIRHWLDDYCSQLTFDGLDQLHVGMRDRELAILFRNSHFATIFKYKNCIFLLNTDIGFLDSNLIWEHLNNVDGDTNHVGYDFVLSRHATVDHTQSVLSERLERQRSQQREHEDSIRLQEIVVEHEASRELLHSRHSGMRDRSRMRTCLRACSGVVVICFVITFIVLAR
eukprot:GEMP01056885.1.p1 GENE.GEMP01056885.1~~GEMP01056885.1.p1  ORF type:complete len:350 (+),score=69.08 GEMP01056885.1:143-1192(+)